MRFIRYYNVFNIESIDGIDPDLSRYMETKLSDNQKIEECEQIIKNMPFKIIYNYLTMCLLMFNAVYLSLVVRAQVGPL